MIISNQLRKFLQIAVFFLMNLTLLSVHAQLGLAKVDSLKKELTKAKVDTMKINLMNEIAYEMNRMSDTNSLIYSKKAFKMAEAIGYSKGKAMSTYNFAWVYDIRGDYKTTLKYHKTALAFIDSVSNPREYAKIVAEIGNCHVFLGNPEEALKSYFFALRTFERIGDKMSASSMFVGIGNSYYYLNDTSRCLSSYRKALELQTALGNKRGALSSLANLGIIYTDLGQYDLAIQYHNKSLEIELEFGQKNGIAQTYNNIGIAYFRKGDEKKAIEFYNKAKVIYLEIGDQKGLINSSNNISSIYQSKKQYSEALVGYLSVKDMVEELGNKPEMKNLYKSLSEVYVKMNDFKNAYDYIIKHDSVNQLIFDQDKMAKMNELSVQYETKEKDLLIKNSENENRAQRAEIAEKDEKDKRKNQLIIFFSVALLLVGILAIVIYKSMVRIRKSNKLITQQKEEIQNQKEIVEEKNKEITDSISYAKRLQDAILPQEKSFKEIFPESFILYKPKDIVAGDFYWMEVVQPSVFSSQSSVISSPSSITPVTDLSTANSPLPTVFFAVADCTGHGVPGAMVSVVCSNALNRTVKEFGFSDPGKILDKVTELVIETFEKSEEQVLDGMDIALCCLKLKSNTGTFKPQTSNLELSFSGANNPLWILRDSTGEIEVIEADKQPIGRYFKAENFNAKNTTIFKGDQLFIFSDGFGDQFGGPNGKKFRLKNLRELITSLKNNTASEQMRILNEKLEEWKGKIEQNDDITLMGIHF